MGNPLIFIAVCAILFCLGIWALVRMGAKFEKEPPENLSKVAPVGKDGLSPYSAKPEDPDRSRVADKCFISSQYSFWDDIFHYGGSKMVVYPSPELCMYHLHRNMHLHEYQNGETFTGKEIREDLLKDYCFMAWYLDNTDRSVFAMTVDTTDFFERATEDGEGCRFLGFSWIDKQHTLLWEERLRIDISDDGMVANKILEGTDWRNAGGQLLNMDADAFEKAVMNFNEHRE